MNWQKFIGLTLGIVAGLYIWNNSDWNIIMATMLYGIGGVIYGDAD